jgi:hypothetical protein
MGSALNWSAACLMNFLWLVIVLILRGEIDEVFFVLLGCRALNVRATIRSFFMWDNFL